MRLPSAKDISSLSDDSVDVFDLLDLLAQWGTNGPAAIIAEPFDNVEDLVALLKAWGACSP